MQICVPLSMTMCDHIYWNTIHINTYIGSSKESISGRLGKFSHPLGFDAKLAAAAEAKEILSAAPYPKATEKA